MGFWSGFAQGFTEAQDRRERRKLLMQELGQKRQDALLKAYQGKYAKTESRGQQEAALQELQARIGDAEGGEELIEALRKTGTALDASNLIAEIESKDKTGELNLTGETLVNSLRVYGGDEARVEPSAFLQNILRNPDLLVNPENYAIAASEIASMPEGGKTGLVRINNAATYAGGNEGRTDAVKTYYSYLSTNLANALTSTNPDGTSKFSTKTAMDMEKAISDLNSDKPQVQKKAAAYWTNSPYGLEAYQKMMDSEVPAFQDIGTVPDFETLNTAYDYSKNWETLAPEQKEEALRQYPYIPSYLGLN